MKSALWIPTMLVSLFSTACSTDHKQIASSDEGVSLAKDEESEQKIALGQVPPSVKQAALAAVPGLVLSAAEREVEHGVLKYSLEGKVADTKYEVEVSSDGKVLEIEKGGDKDRDDDGDDDGDDDDDKGG